MRPLSRRGLLSAALILWPMTAMAGPMGGDPPPDDGPPGGRGQDDSRDQGPPPHDVLLEATQTVDLEHSDRIFRLRQATERLGVYPPPGFSTYTVPARRMPDNFHVDTPVLRVVFAEAVFFDTARDRLRPEARNILDAVAQSLRGDAPDAAVFVSGHTDNRGAEDYNYNLSINRANAVAEGLLDRGVGEVALWRVGFGEAVPLYPNDTPEHLGFNRRVEFLFASRTEPILDYLSHQLDTVCIADDSRTADRCRHEVHVRERFTAVQLTHRPMGIGLDRPMHAASSSRLTTSRTQTSGRGGPPQRVTSHPQTSNNVAAPPVRVVTPPARTTSGHTTSASPFSLNTPTRRTTGRQTANTSSTPVISQEVAINLHTRQATVQPAP